MDIDSLINHPEWLLLVLAPLFLLCMLAEYFIGQKQGRLPDNSSYKLYEVLCNF
ncbi:sterol desaturase family protein, partial [Vibrio lentus]